jgi:S-adenosylmethionine/arginine decarboxylase-like enzyme
VEHKHLLLNATFEQTPFTDTKFTENWLKKIVDLIGMEILHNPIAVKCDEKDNEGISAFCLITTSHLSLHSWEKRTPNLLQLDVYSCRTFDQDLIEQELKKFNPLHLGSKFLDRRLINTKGWRKFDEGLA